MWLRIKVSKKKRITSHLLAAATLAALFGNAGRLEAEASRVSFTTQSSGLANDRNLMDAERNLLHSLATEPSEVVDTPKTPAKKQAQAVVAKKTTSERKGELASTTTSTAVTKTTLSTGETKAPVAKPVVEAKGPPPEFAAKLRSLEASTDSMRSELQRSRERVALLERQLDESRSQLSIAETEVTRLSGLLDSKTRASLGKYNLPMPAAAPVKPVVAQPAPRQASAKVAQPVVDVRPPSADADLQVATVAVDKADLRLGPGKNHSALMSLRRGSRLMVEARQGEWYRVFAPNGDRAWIAASLVTFGDGASTLNDGSSVRVKGFTANAEEEAFRRVHRSTN
jgi:hypothetical protein